MARGGRTSGMRPDPLARFGDAWGVIREGRRALEAEVLSVWQTVPGLLPMLRRRFLGAQEAGRLLLDPHPTVGRPQRVGAVPMTRRRRGAGQQVRQPLLGGGARASPWQ